jgi:hypothetical protein
LLEFGNNNDYIFFMRGKDIWMMVYRQLGLRGFC